MAQLAVALLEQGYQVSGSDKAFFEPMGSFLKKTSIQLFDSYSKENISKDLDLVIIGNAISYGHPEVLELEKLNLNYSLFTQCFYDLAINNRKSIVVSGTHGKTTTSYLTTAIFKSINLNPSYFVGGIGQELDKCLEIGEKYCITEGDEYDSVFFAKFSKFHFYKPDILIINALEFDHADIFNSIEDIENEFIRLIQNMPKNGTVLYSSDCENIKTMLNKVNLKDLKIISFGFKNNPNFLITSTEENFQQKITVTNINESFNYTLSMIGEHNARNSVAGILVTKVLNLFKSEVLENITKFKGVKRRQEIWHQDQNYILIEDFAHHPTAVDQTIDALKRNFKDFKILIIFEPRSNTSKRDIHSKEYSKVLNKADYVIISDEHIESEDGLNLKTIKNELKDKLLINMDHNIIIDHLNNKKSTTEKLLCCVMSNGSFNGLIKKL